MSRDGFTHGQEDDLIVCGIQKGNQDRENAVTEVCSVQRNENRTFGHDLLLLVD